ncbi:MAG TPA: alpha/beta fold hydrolase [Candidatus Binatia bacterium]|nr:alpha/beta fold hydrolase [Candidatus Binatia bacterium]
MKLEHVSIHGHRVAFRTAGTGPVVLLIHGMAGSSATWRHVLPALAQRFTVLAPDLLGHGESGKPRRGEYALAAHANVLRDLLNVLGHQRATFVGQSLGGGIAMQLAYQFPERCERLVLVSSGGLGQEVNWLLRALTVPGADYVFPFLCGPRLRDAGAWIASWLHSVGFRAAPAVEEIWRSYASLADAETRRAFFRTLRSVVDLRGQAVSAHNRLYLTSMLPTLIVWGGQDPIIPADHATEAHKAMPRSRLVMFERAGHFPHCEVPDQFVEAFVDFMTTTEPAQMSETRWRELLRGEAVEPAQNAPGASGGIAPRLALSRA